MSTPDEITAAAAEAHAAEHGHTVGILPGQGWVCEVCDDDAEEVIADFHAGRPTTAQTQRLQRRIARKADVDAAPFRVWGDFLDRLGDRIRDNGDGWRWAAQDVWGEASKAHSAAADVFEAAHRAIVALDEADAQVRAEQAHRQAIADARRKADELQEEAAELQWRADAVSQAAALAREEWVRLTKG